MGKTIKTPLTYDEIENLKAGDSIFLSGYIYTARDAAHKRLVELIKSGQKLPFDISDEVIYYAGPSPAKLGMPIGSVGPTSSYRMDSYAPYLLDMGLKGMIGKGARSRNVINSIVKNKAVYFGAIGGVAVLISKCVKSAEVIAYRDLGAEAVRKLYVEKFPLIVIVDKYGNNYYEIGQREYLRSIGR